MKLISLNISKKKSIEYNGKKIETAIFKTPVQGSLQVLKDHIDGDEQADLQNHGGDHKAVYAFSYDHYDYWRNALKNPSLNPGDFGENLTISSLDEAKIFIGDQFEIGDCILEVSQPRMPCFKLGIALNNTQAVKLITKSYRTGVYFRVIKEGSISVNDTVKKINEQSSSLSIETLFQAYFDKSYSKSEDVFKQALALKTLAPEWRKAIEGRF